MRKLSRLCLALFALLLSPPVTAASAQAAGSGFDFSIKNIMRGPEVYGREPSNVRWSADGRWIYFGGSSPARTGDYLPERFASGPSRAPIQSA